MMKHRDEPDESKIPLAFRIAFIVVITGVLTLVVIRSRYYKGPNFCPIDGRIAQWTKPRSNSLCDYGHFSLVERNEHTWSAPCP